MKTLSMLEHRFLSGVLAVVLWVPMKAQETKAKPFGEVSMEEMKVTACPYDSSASAMILFDKGEFEMNIDNFTSSYKRHVRIKILKKEAADDWANEAIYYAKEGQSFGRLKATTYNLVNGKIEETKIDGDAIFKGKFDRYFNQAKFTLPKVNDGSVIEYSYIISSDLGPPPSWQFQYDIPVLWSEYSMIIPNYFTFRKDLQGFYYPKSDGKGSTERLVLQNLPAFKEEPFMTSEENYIAKINLYLEKFWAPGQTERNFIKSWGSVAKSVYESELGTQIRSSGYLKKTVEEVTAGMTDPEKKVHAIYDYVKKNISWNDMTDVYPDRQFKEVLDKKSGSSSEINGILISMLKRTDIDADPVLVRTRDEGFIKPFLPVYSQFNDVICQVKIGEKKMLIDATVAELPMNVLPLRCINGQGLLVVKDNFEWVDLVSTRSRRSASGDFILAEDGSLSGKLTISHDGLYASSMRKDYKKEGEEKYLKSFTEGKTWELTKSTFENIEDYKNAVKEIHELTVADFGQAAGPVIYINPILYDRMEENPFKLEKRDYPVDYGNPFDEVYLGKIAVPEGYMVDELPKPKIILLPENAGKFVYNATVTGNVVNIMNQFIINKSSFDPEQYLNLREFYTQIVAKQNEQIVLKKK